MKTLAGARDDQHKSALDRIEGSIDQHPADQGNERSPVADHEVRQGTAHRLPKVDWRAGSGLIAACTIVAVRTPDTSMIHRML